MYRVPRDLRFLIVLFAVFRAKSELKSYQCIKHKVKHPLATTEMRHAGGVDIKKRRHWYNTMRVRTEKQSQENKTIQSLSLHTFVASTVCCQIFSATSLFPEYCTPGIKFPLLSIRYAPGAFAFVSSPCQRYVAQSSLLTRRMRPRTDTTGAVARIQAV